MKDFIKVICEDFVEIDFWYSDAHMALYKFKQLARNVEEETGVRHSHVDPYIGVMQQLHDNIKQRCIETEGSYYGKKFRAQQEELQKFELASTE